MAGWHVTDDTFTSSCVAKSVIQFCMQLPVSLFPLHVLCPFAYTTMGDIKARLKRVKELIDTQEWQKAYDISERILSEDSNQIHARLFMGKCAMELDKPDRAIECFRMAAKIQPDQIAAWQGIIVFYGKYKQVEEKNDELMESYKRCLDHLGDDEKLKPKIIEYLLGYSRQLGLKGETDGLQPILERLIHLATGFTFKDARVEGRQKLIRLILPKKYETDLAVLPPAQLDLLLSTFEDLLSEFDQRNLDENYPQEHLNTLLRLAKNNEADRFARNYIERFDALFAVATVFMAALQKSLTAGAVAESDRGDMSLQEKLATIELQHPLVRIGKAFQAFQERNYRKSAELLEKALSAGKGIVSLSPAYKVSFMVDIELYAKKFLGISWISLGESESVTKGLNLLTEVRGKLKDWEIFFYIGYAQIETVGVTAAEDTLKEGYRALAGDQDSKITLGALEAFIALQKKDYETAEVLSENALVLMEKNHLFHYVLFRCLWDNRRRDPRRCISHLTRSIELYPDFALPHIYWGFYIWRENSDIEGAKEQFELAFKLLPDDIRVIRAFTDFCTLGHRDERAIEILRQSIQSNKHPAQDGKWMRLRLALLCYRNKFWHECISNLRHILRSHPDDRLVQEFLADALTFRGNYWSAAGMFESVVSSAKANQGQSAEYSLYRLASIRQKLKLDDEAEAGFLLLHKTASSDFRGMCLISLAEIELRKAKTAFKSCLPVIGVACCQKAVDFLSEAVTLNLNSPMTWSLLGDACVMMRYVRPGDTVLLIDKFLWDGSEQVGKMSLNIRQVLYLATVFYAVAIDLKRTSCRLWERLAVSYFFLAKRIATSGDVEASRNWMKRSLLAVREMLHRNPYNPWVWHTAGLIVAASDRSTEIDACRLYTKSIELFRHFELNPTVVAATWSALGFIYVNKKRYIAANALLTKGQSADPKLAEGWMGQAWCAERLGHPVEAMDLCRHACSLGLAKEAMRRYGEWVVWLCQNRDQVVDKQMRRAILDRLDSVSTAANYLFQFLQLGEDDIKTSMVVSLLLEWNGLSRSALEWSRKALSAIESSENRFEPEGAEVWDMAKLNLARLLCENGLYDESLSILETIETEPSLGMVLVLAVVHFHLQDFDQALAMLEVAVGMSEEDNAKAAIQLATAVVHLCRGNHEEAGVLTEEMLKNSSVSEELAVDGDLILSLVKLENDVQNDNSQLSQCWDVFLLSSSTAADFPLSDDLEARQQCTQSASGRDSSNDSSIISRLVHLHPTRIDFRFSSLDDPARQLDLGDTDKLAQHSSDFLPLSECMIRPSKEFWHFFAVGGGGSPVCDDAWSVATQKAVHLFPYEVSWWK